MLKLRRLRVATALAIIALGAVPVGATAMSLRVNIGGSAGLEQQALSQAVADALARAAERLHEQKTTGAGQAAEPGQADDRGESAESEAPMPPAPRPDLSS